MAGEPLIEIKMVLGTVHLPRPTGRWVQDPDGWWRELYEPGFTVLPDGSVTDITEFDAPTRISMPPLGFFERQLATNPHGKAS